jgi:alkaline phosphatase
MLDSVITDSAAAATAFATGYKTSDGFLGVAGRPEGVLSTEQAPSAEEQYRPLATVLEAAKVMGKATGLIATSRITHATPAAFASHIHSRSLDNEIMEHMVYTNIDVVFGGGKRHLLTTTQGGKRTDGEDLLAELVDRGYQFVETRGDMLALSSGRAWGLFASSHMAADIDRAEVAPDEPSLAEMTSKAIELLSQDPDGFFLMVEGSQIDWAGHANDPIYMVTDTLAFDEAFKAAVDFAQQEGNTLVVAFPDHNTGAMAIGHNYTEHGYTATTVEDVIGPLQGMKVTGFVLASKIAEAAGGSPTKADIVAGVKEWWGLDITDDDAQEVLDLMASAGLSLDYALGSVISKNYTYFGWTTFGHSGEDVPLWSYGPHRIVGGIDNTDIPKRIAKAMGTDLDVLTAFLYADVSKYISDFQVDGTDPANPVMKSGVTSVPISKDYVAVDGYQDLKIQLPAVAVHAPMTDRCYLSLTGISLIEAFNGGPSKSFRTNDLDRQIESMARQIRLAPEYLEAVR